MTTATENAIEQGTTVYRKSVKDALAAKTILKKGSSNAKLGFKVTSKKWKDSRLFSLTLEERATCPRTCHHWADCYGNNMPFAHRYTMTDSVLDQLAIEIKELCEKYPKGVVIRLHVLGDFFSREYVSFWEDMLFNHKNLRLFGYTGRVENSDIGNAIWLLNNRFSERVAIRFSQNKEQDEYSYGCTYAAEESFQGKGFWCPEQDNKVSSCADCGLCWMTKKTVIFKTH